MEINIHAPGFHTTITICLPYIPEPIAMPILSTIKKIFSHHRITLQKEAAEAYNLWAGNYDRQPDNLMLFLDNQLFHHFIQSLDISNQVVLDIGCGTGRHWARILDRHPAQLAGYDVSDGMLSELKKKYPAADTHLATDSLLSGIRDASADVIISTLTIAHIANLEEAISAWERVLKPGGHLVLTDFHPAVLEAGGKRDFVTQNTRIEIRNYVHSIEKIKRIAQNNQFIQLDYQEKVIDERVKHFYEKQHALHVYRRFEGLPIIYGFHFRKL
jgi:ubiquinone/menaquinone biosynthesis C-methylase UbiE